MSTSTTIEQSEHLIKLGIDPRSADLVYMPFETNVRPKALNIDCYLTVIDGTLEDNDIPAWSLSALFSFLPIECKLEKTLLDQSDYFTYSCVWTDEYRTTEYENPIDAVYEMLCYVKENYE